MGLTESGTCPRSSAFGLSSTVVSYNCTSTSSAGVTGVELHILASWSCCCSSLLEASVLVRMVNVLTEDLRAGCAASSQATLRLSSGASFVQLHVIGVNADTWVVIAHERDLSRCVKEKTADGDT